ncbi:MAG TPA: UDP-N-acetylmuramoyl-L-alanine--D-glutamate ligase [Burkholderiales bacterium]
MREPAFSLLEKPAPIPLRGRRVLVLGLGDTGLSAARWVERSGGVARVADTRPSPPRKSDFRGELRTGPFGNALLEGMDLVCISPGLPLDAPLIMEAMRRRIPVVGDVELFAWQNAAKVLAITGTNGKSTVTALTGHLLNSAGVDCEVAGNISPPVLDSLLSRKTPPAVWVLELSSYQLETTWSLEPHAATVLNVTEDHLDRYAGLDDYAAAKARVFQGEGAQILNRDDPRVLAMALPGRKQVTFGLSDSADFCIRDDALIGDGKKLIETAALPIRGRHNYANALAACALAATLDVSLDALAPGLRTFKGLPHRLELVRTRRGVEWYDDSKGTNVGATIAALKGLAKPAVLILGGEGKGQDFSPLAAPAAQFARAVLLIGRDAPMIEKAVAGERCASLEAAVVRAAELARPGEAVLLSPACASFDMFRDYKHRGEVFAAAVKELPA